MSRLKVYLVAKMTSVLAVEEGRPGCIQPALDEDKGCEVRHIMASRGQHPNVGWGTSRDQFIPGHPGKHDFIGSGVLVTC